MKPTPAMIEAGLDILTANVIGITDDLVEVMYEEMEKARLIENKLKEDIRAQRIKDALPDITVSNISEEIKK